MTTGSITQFPIPTETIDNLSAAGTLQGNELVALKVPGGATLNSPVVAIAALTTTNSLSGPPLPVAKGGTGTSTPAIVPGSGVSVSGSWPNQAVGQRLGYASLSLKSQFNSAVANAPLIANYQFGTGVAGGPGITTIMNLIDLAANFNPLEDFTQGVTINSEIQRYESFNASNHQFLTDRLNLVGLNPNNDWNCQVTQIAGTVNLNNTASTIAALGLPNTASQQVGQIVCVQGRGTYVITAIVANTSVTLQQLGGSSTTAVTASPSAMIFWMPVQSAVLTANYVVNTGTTLTFASVPPGVLGMQMAHYNSSNNIVVERNQDYRIAAASATTVDLNTPWNFSSLNIGERILFLPVVTSGQIWSKLQFDITNPQTFFALEFSVDSLPLAAQPNTTQGVTTLAALSALPNTVPWGGWPTGWCYSADDGNSTTETLTIAEIDVVEPQISASQGCQEINAGNFGGVITGGALPPSTVFVKTDSGWAYSTAFGIVSKTDGSDFTGNHLWQLVFCNGKTYRFWDGVLFNVKNFNWGGQAPLQFAANLACGSIEAAYGSNTLFPNASTNFTGMTFGIKSIKVWYQTP
jgi:hypothetical protein